MDGSQVVLDVTDPTTLPATALAAAVRSGQLSPVDVTRAYLDRIARVPKPDKINALDYASACYVQAGDNTLGKTHDLFYGVVKAERGGYRPILAGMALGNYVGLGAKMG